MAQFIPVHPIKWREIIVQNLKCVQLLDVAEMSYSYLNQTLLNFGWELIMFSRFKHLCPHSSY